MYEVCALFLLVVSSYADVTFKIKNTSERPVFVQVHGTEYADPWTLQPNDETVLNYPEPWSGRIWGRVDCYSVKDCALAGPIPASLAEFSVNDGNGFYDVSLVDGFNIELRIDQENGHEDGTDNKCKSAKCDYPILDDCPDELKLLNKDGDLVSCLAACNAFGTDAYCCRGEHNTANTCNSTEWPVDYANFFKQRCPDAYCYTYDDPASTYYCDTNQYVITFL